MKFGLSPEFDTARILSEAVVGPRDLLQCVPVTAADIVGFLSDPADMTVAVTKQRAGRVTTAEGEPVRILGGLNAPVRHAATAHPGRHAFASAGVLTIRVNAEGTQVFAKGQRVRGPVADVLEPHSTVVVK